MTSDHDTKQFRRLCCFVVGTISFVILVAALITKLFAVIHSEIWKVKSSSVEILSKFGNKVEEHGLKKITALEWFTGFGKIRPDLKRVITT